MKLPTLYKFKKKLLQWEIETIHHNTYSEYQVTHGQQGGKLQTTSTTITKGKNIGKANETSISEQCDLEAKALWQKQIDRKGYSYDHAHTNKLLEILAGKSFTDTYSPMLAHEYDKHSHKVKFPCYVQPKLDGIRCLAWIENDKVVLFSRQRKEFAHLDHIKADLLPILQANPNLVLDGELYKHGWDFQKIVSAVKRDEPNELTSEVEYHIYDMVSQDIYETRNKKLSEVLSIHKNSIYQVVSWFLEDKRDIDAFHTIFTGQGFEGLMIRNSDGLYKQDGRSYDLLKYKEFIDQDFPVVGAIQNKGKLVNTCVFELDHNGTVFKAMPEGTQEEREQLWADWQAGKIKVGDIATVKFFAWTVGENPVPRFPIFMGVRYEC